MLKTFKLAVGMLGSNCFLAWDNKSGEGVVIDPGADGERIIQAVREREFTVKWILNTHGHGDHIGANGMLKQEYNVPLLIHELDSAMLSDPAANMSLQFGPPIASPPAARFLLPADKIQFGGVALEVIHTPGHSPGGVCLYDGVGTLFSGDTLFPGSVGRWDLPGGDQDLLLRSIRERILVLPDETEVLPGHGQNTTIGQEKRWNPFLA